MSQEEWEKNQQKHIDESLQYEKDMETLDHIEQAHKNWNFEVRSIVEEYWINHEPEQYKAYAQRRKLIADIKFQVVVKGHGCTAGPGSNPPYLHETFSCYQRWDTPVEAVCSECDASLIIDPLTISSVKAKFIPKCLGCDMPLYQHKEAEVALCPKCDKIWCNVNQHLQPYGEESLVGHTSPMPGQILRRLSNFNGSYTDPVSYDIVKEPSNANLITSEVAGTLNHKPILDIDLPCKLIQSTHAGHHHLYIDKAMSWEDYKELMETLAKVGIIQKGYRDASVAREFSSVRLPWIKKTPKKDEDDEQPKMK